MSCLPVHSPYWHQGTMSQCDIYKTKTIYSCGSINIAMNLVDNMVRIDIHIDLLYDFDSEPLRETYRMTCLVFSTKSKIWSSRLWSLSLYCWQIVSWAGFSTHLSPSSHSTTFKNVVAIRVRIVYLLIERHTHKIHRNLSNQHWYM